MGYFNVLLPFVWFCFCVSVAEDSKRILVNDPSYFESRIRHLETITQTQAATIAQQQTAINALQQQNAAIKKQETTLQILYQNLSRQNVEIDYLRNSLNAEISYFRKNIQTLQAEKGE